VWPPRYLAQRPVEYIALGAVVLLDIHDGQGAHGVRCPSPQQDRQWSEREGPRVAAVKTPTRVRARSTRCSEGVLVWVTALSASIGHGPSARISPYSQCLRDGVTAALALQAACQ
jgi:hypothetical protein